MSKVPRLSKVTSTATPRRAAPPPPFDARELLKSLPHRPGVYRMFDAAGETLYVGKARDLKKRVANYFQKTGHEPRIAAMVAQVARVETTVTRSEGEALLLENNLIKARGAALQHPLPRRQELSVRLPHAATRFRSCASIAARSIARIAISARSRARARCAKASRILQKVFQLRTCENTVFANRSRPCMLHQIQRCSAPCVGLISEADYREDVAGARPVPAGQDRRGADAACRRRWTRRRGRLEFERAARIRDKITRLQSAAVAAVRRERDCRRHRRRRRGGGGRAGRASTS